jgi:succinyl-CoA synthetase beta subunit
LRLHEYQTKSLLAQFGIPVPLGKIATTPEQAAEIARELNSPVVIKPQILSENNYKSLNIGFAQTPQLAQEYTFNIMKEAVNGQNIHSVLVETSITAVTKIYLTIINDYEINKPIIIVSEKDSHQINYVDTNLDNLVYEAIDPFIGLLDYQARELAGSINLPFEYWKSFTKIAQDLFRCYVANDALEAEINPLGITDQNEFFALGGLVVIDNKALYRQNELADMNTAQISEIQQRRMSYIKMNGQIACAVNGSGLALTILDMIALNENEAMQSANLIEMGDEAQTHKVETALRIIFNDNEIKAAFINIWGGITGCATIALSILQIIEETQTQIPIIIRLTGNQAHEGQKIINASKIPGIYHAVKLTDAVQKVISAASMGRVVNGDSR